MNNIESIAQSGECCGCEACINICPADAIQYSKDVFGFAVPSVDHNKCVSCSLCMKTCPAIWAHKKTSVKAYAAISCDQNLRYTSSSGGIFGAISNTILDAGGVVFGCTMDDDFVVRHIAIEKKENLSTIQRSKYVQSRMSAVYSQIRHYLAEGKVVLFSGTPCQVSAVNNFLCAEEKKKLITIDIVCHGVPSQDLFDDYVTYLENKKGKIKEYRFRTKKKVDGGMQWYSSYVLERNNKRVVFDWTEDSYNYLYMCMNTNRESCYSCKYASMERPSDITLCDYWHWDNYHKASFPEGTTLSGVLVNSHKGENIMEKVSKDLSVVETRSEYIAKANGALCNPSGDLEMRNRVLTCWKEYGYQKLDMEFREKHRKEVIKGVIRRNTPECIYTVFGDVKRIVKKITNRLR